MTCTVQLDLGGSPVPRASTTRSRSSRSRRTPTGPTRSCCGCRSTGPRRRPPVRRRRDLRAVRPTSRSWSPRRGRARPSASSTATCCPGSCTSTAPRRRRRIDVWAQDASWLMNIDDTCASGPGMTDGEVANAIFGSYGFTPAGGEHRRRLAHPHPDGAHAVPARDGPAVPARPGPARRQAVPGRLHRHARASAPATSSTPAVDGQPGRRRSPWPTRTAGRSTRSTSTGT